MAQDKTAAADFSSARELNDDLSAAGIVAQAKEHPISPGRELASRLVATGAQAGAARNITSVDSGWPARSWWARHRTTLSGLAAAAVVAFGLFIALQPSERPADGFKSVPGSGDLAGQPVVFAPRGTVHYQRPTIIWQNTANTSYAVEISLPGAKNPLFVARDVRSPLPFAALTGIGDQTELATGLRYSVSIRPVREVDAATEVAFSVASDSQSEIPAFEIDTLGLDAVRAEISRSNHADALMLLMALPDEAFLRKEVQVMRREIEQKLRDL